MPEFSDFLSQLKDDLITLSKEGLNEFRDQVVQDGTSFALKTREDLERWTTALANGNLTPEDFQFLLKGKKDLAEMEALKLAGFGKIRLNKIRNQIIDTIVGSALKFFL